MEIVSLAERPDLAPAAFEIPYGADDGVFMQGSPVPLLVRRSRLVKRWPDYVLVLVDQTGSAVARGVMVPFCAQEPGRERFPAGGWDQVAIWAAEDAMDQRRPDTACALEIVVHPDHYGRGLSEVMLAGLRRSAASHGRWTSTSGGQRQIS